MAINNTSREVAELMNRVMAEINGRNIDYSSNHSSNVGLLSFMLAFDYFDSTLYLIEKSRVLSAGALLRSSLENMADIFFILTSKASKVDERAKSYVESINIFRSAMVSAHNKAGEAEKVRLLKNVNQWSTSNITDRLRDIGGNSLLTTYDMLSYFSHPNPGLIEYIVNEELRNGELIIIESAICVNAVHLIAIMIQYSEIRSVGKIELEAIAQKIGTSVFENPNV